MFTNSDAGKASEFAYAAKNVPAVEKCVHAFKDTSYIYDDLYREPDTKTRHENERRLKSIFRSYADDSSRQKINGGYDNNAQLVVTAEYLLQSKTDVGRCMVINVDTPIDKGRLTECQADPLVLSTFIYYFIKWLSRNYDEIVAEIKNEFRFFRVERAKKGPAYERFHEAYFLLKFAIRTFNNYAMEVPAMTNETAELINEEFLGYVRDAFAYQEIIMDNLRKKEKKNTNISKELLLMISRGYIVLGSKNTNCFRKHKYIYITCRYLCEALYKFTGEKLTGKSVAKYFADRFISEVYETDKNTKNVKKYNKMNYLVLDEGKLTQDACNGDSRIESLFY